MKIFCFEIENYRAIEKVRINLSFSINPIIGVNESGKTTVLKAILAFDKNRDKLNFGEHLEFQNKYATSDTKGCKIKGSMRLDKGELSSLNNSLLKYANAKDVALAKKFNTKTEFVLTRELSKVENKYHFSHEGFSDKANERVTKFLVSNLPFILYFDDFSDRVPDTIDFPMDYIRTGKLTRNKNREWQEIIEEIFKRADTEGIDDKETHLTSFMTISDVDRKGDILSDIQDELNKEIIKEWKRIKKTGKAFADDSEKLELEIENKGSCFQFKVKDKSFKDKTRTFNISQRSKGFQWFFNYMIKLKFNPNYKLKLENSLFLLDEPGSYLHSAAQVELLNELKRVSNNNTIIYCTHSQYLLNPTVIKLGSVKIADKSKSKIILQDYGTYKVKKDKGALSPIYEALQLNFAHDFVGKIVITEGITDFYLFRIIQENTNWINEDVKFIPGSGASQSSNLISFAVSFSDDFVVFLDNDKAGLDAKRKYKSEFGEAVGDKLFIYRETESKFTLEDYLSTADCDNLLELTKSIDLKRGLGFLFYDYKQKQHEFVSKLNNETKDNLEDCLNRIEALVLNLK